MHDDAAYLSAPSPNPSNNGSHETFIDPSPIAPSSNGTEFTDLDEAVEHQNGQTTKASGPSTHTRDQDYKPQQPELTVGQVIKHEYSERGLICSCTDQNLNIFTAGPIAIEIR